MRITRETLLKAAKDWTAARLRQDRNVVCVYLTGSLLGEEPLLGGTTDIDLIFVHPNDPEKPREIVRLTDDVHIDVAHLSQSVFHQPRHLRLDAWVGSYLCAGPLMLHDTQHWFEFTQASAFSQFFRPENVMERSRPAADAARQTWLELHSLTGAPDAHARWAYLKALENAANAIAVLNGPPLTERRFLLQFPQRAQAVGRPGLAGGLVDLFMPEKPDAETWQMWQLYYERAADALFSDHPEAAVWMLLRTWTLTLTSLPEDSSLLIAWENACLSCGLGGSEFNHRLASLDTYLDSVEETLDIWAQQNGA
jgi:hypothetical protein